MGFIPKSEPVGINIYKYNILNFVSVAEKRIPDKYNSLVFEFYAICQSHPYVS